MPKVLQVIESRFTYDVYMEDEQGRRAMFNIDKMLADVLGPSSDSKENAAWLALRDFSET